jgi:hypothetical protein
VGGQGVNNHAGALAWAVAQLAPDAPDAVSIIESELISISGSV